MMDEIIKTHEPTKESIFPEGLKFIKGKKFQIALTIIVFLIILISSTNIRMSNINNLKDETDGQYILSDLDALYFLRLSEVVLHTGNLDGIDNMRYLPLNVTYSQEIMPYVMVGMYNFVKIFNSEVTIRYIDAISPAIFYLLALIIFFFLVYVLTKSKTISLLASAFLAYSPAYLFRTMTGVSDHEAIGMVPFFAVFLVFVLGLKRFNRSWKETIIWAALSGFFTALTVASWGGALNFVLMIFPIAILICFLFNVEDNDFERKKKIILFSGLWIVFSTLSVLLVGFPIMGIVGRFTSSYGLLVPLVIAFMIIDTIVQKYNLERYFGKTGQKIRIIYSAIITALLGLVGLVILGKNPLSMIYQIYVQLLHPWGLERIGLTVAENAQPYLNDWIGQTGQIIFWFFIFGMIYVGIDIAKNIKQKQHKIYFTLSWIAAIVGILFSRISANSLFNGTNLISEALYIAGFGIFIAYFVWLYFNDRFKINEETVFLFAWMIIMLISGRSAIRTIFAVTPFVCVAAAYFVFKTYDYIKNSKEEVVKNLLWGVLIIAIILSFVSLFVNYSPLVKDSSGSYSVSQYPGSYQAVVSQAKYIGPSANSQWQNAMAWARNNTGLRDIFVHWWDYGYFVQTLGLRPTVTDGGHANGYWDHLTGRYLLTTPYPETALSFMKTQNVSYLLIDPSDLGKYGAYSKIGGNKDNDRYSSPPVVVADAKQTIETANGVKKVYLGTTFVDEDISYNGTLLPGPIYDDNDLPTYKSYFLGIILEQSNASKSVQVKQPIGVFAYNSKQYQLPIRYLYLNGQIMDFKTGIESTFMIVPYLAQNSNGGISSDSLGAGIYLSKKVSEGLFGQLYLMNDVNNKYPTIKVAHSEDDPVVKAIKAQGMNVGEFVYFQGLRAPLKIWKVEYSSNVLAREEFIAETGEYGGLDNLTFTI